MFKWNDQLPSWAFSVTVNVIKPYWFDPFEVQNPLLTEPALRNN